MQLRRRCITERKALHALAAAKRKRGGGAPGAPAEAPGGPPSAVDELPISVSSMRFCIPFFSHRFAAGRKEVGT